MPSSLMTPQEARATRGRCIGDTAEETHNFKERMNSFAILNVRPLDEGERGE